MKTYIRLTDEELIVVENMVHKGMTLSAIGKKFNMPNRYISSVWIRAKQKLIQNARQFNGTEGLEHRSSFFGNFENTYINLLDQHLKMRRRTL